MPLITDWFMVGITAIYVIATIIITVANMKSTKITKDQLMTSIQQYEEKKRLEAMPHLTVAIEEHDPSKNYVYTNGCKIYVPQSPSSWAVTEYSYYDLIISNVGWGAAKNVNMILNGKKGVDAEFNIRIGAIAPKDTNYLACTFVGEIDKVKIDKVEYAMIEAEFVLEYFDLLGNKYKQITSMRFEASEDSLKLTAYSTSDNELVKLAGE